MQRNADEAASIQQSVIEGYERERDHWKARALRAEAQLMAAHDRLSDLIFAPLNPGEEEDFLTGRDS